MSQCTETVLCPFCLTMCCFYKFRKFKNIIKPPYELDSIIKLGHVRPCPNFHCSCSILKHSGFPCPIQTAHERLMLRQFAWTDSPALHFHSVAAPPRFSTKKKLSLKNRKPQPSEVNDCSVAMEIHGFHSEMIYKCWVFYVSVLVTLSSREGTNAKDNGATKRVIFQSSTIQILRVHAGTSQST